MGSTVFIIPSDVIKSSGIINPVDPLASAYKLLYIVSLGEWYKNLILKTCLRKLFSISKSIVINVMDYYFSSREGSLMDLAR